MTLEGKYATSHVVWNGKKEEHLKILRRFKSFNINGADDARYRISLGKQKDVGKVITLKRQTLEERGQTGNR